MSGNGVYSQCPVVTAGKVFSVAGGDETGLRAVTRTPQVASARKIPSRNEKLKPDQPVSELAC